LSIFGYLVLCLIWAFEIARVEYPSPQPAQRKSLMPGQQRKWVPTALKP